MKFIALSAREVRCRPEKGFGCLHNDCGMQAQCARRLAANTVGAPEFDLSRTLTPIMGVFMACAHFLSAEKASQACGQK